MPNTPPTRLTREGAIATTTATLLTVTTSTAAIITATWQPAAIGALLALATLVIGHVWDRLFP